MNRNMGEPLLDPPVNEDEYGSTIIRVKVKWDGCILADRYLLPVWCALHHFKMMIINDIIEEIGVFDKDDSTKVWVYSSRFHSDAIHYFREEEMDDTARMLENVCAYPSDNPEFRVRYRRDEFIGYLKGISGQWLKCEEFDFIDVPYEERTRIKCGLEDWYAEQRC